MATIDTAPRDFATLKALIIERGKTLPKRLSQIAAFALEHPDDIAFGTVALIAEQAEVQPSSLIRFSQAMGYQGFSELQEIFRARLRDRVPNYEERIAQLREHARSASKAHILFEGFSEAAQKHEKSEIARRIFPVRRLIHPADEVTRDVPGGSGQSKNNQKAGSVRCFL